MPVRLRAHAIACVAALLLAAMLALPGAAGDAGHVGSDTCIACHAEAGARWSGSHHALA